LAVFLLALDTCDSNGSVALLRDSEAIQTAIRETPDDYSVWLLPAIDRILRAAAVPFSEVEVCAIAAGPGSFTGVRVGLTTAKAWAEVRGMGIAVVSRMEAIASQSEGTEPWVGAFADARRGQVFAALYKKFESRLERVGDEMVIAPEKFRAWAVQQAGSMPIRWISPDPRALTETAAWSASRNSGEVVETASPVLAPVIGRLGYQLAGAGRLTDALSLDANYVRRSDAEVSWTDRHAS
jgi:tRNA threonylcarbamoyladenosine biosynthesis protein TsaB